MDIKNYIYDEYINNKLKIGEDHILQKLYLYKEIRKNINTIEVGIPLLAKISYYLNKYDVKNANFLYNNLVQFQFL